MLSPVLIAPQSIQKMRDWANKFGVAVLQMVKAGTLLSNFDQKGIQPHALLSFEFSGFKLQQKKEKNRQRGKWDIRVWFPSRDEETDGSFPDNKTGCDDGGIPSLEQEAPFIMEDFPTSEEVFASQQNYIQSIFLYFPCCGTNGIAVRFCCFTDTLVDIVICFFDTDLSLLKICFSMIIVKQKEVIIVTSMCHSCKTLKTADEQYYWGENR